MPFSPNVPNVQVLPNARYDEHAHLRSPAGLGLRVRVRRLG